MHFYLLFSTIFFTADVVCVKLSSPSFTSDWKNMSAYYENYLIVNHNLNEYPVKVDVQIKVNDNGTDLLFTGVGSANRDDDLDYPFGGIVYKYNMNKVKLSAPSTSQSFRNYNSGGIAFTGAPKLYSGPQNVNNFYRNGQVRVRVWLQSDFPEPVWNYSVQMSADLNFQTIEHDLGYYPDIVSVQTFMDDGYISDGQGAISILNHNDQYDMIGGVVFGYDAYKIRLWVPRHEYSNSSGGVFFARDGWNLGHARNGTVQIKAWKLDHSQIIYYKKLLVGTDAQVNTFFFPCDYNVSTNLVSVQTLVYHGANKGMTFYGSGSTMATGETGYGGLVYAYNNESLMIWSPSGNSNGYIAHIGGWWGSGQFSQQSTWAGVIIQVFYLGILEDQCQCSTPSFSENVSIVAQDLHVGGYLQYECQDGYQWKRGSFNRYCFRNLSWSGSEPMCVLKNESSFNLDGMQISKKTTSQNRRKFISVWDNRPSSICIGSFGIIIFVVFVCAIFFPDICILLKHLTDHRSVFKKKKKKTMLK